MTLFCIHKPYTFTTTKVIMEGDKHVEIPGVRRCSRCGEAWYENEPEPKVALGRIE